MSLTVIALIGIAVMLILLLLGMNIGLSMLLVGVVGYGYCVSVQAGMGLLQTNLYTAGASYSLSVVPLFVLMGEFAYCSGLSQRLFDCATLWLNRVPGNLACASIVACAAFGAICGSPAATAATVGVVALPEMKKQHYDDGLAVGSISVGGTLGIMIPPSTAFILYGVSAGESIGALFASGVIPGILLTILCCLIVVFRVVRDPTLAPGHAHYEWKQRFRALRKIWGVAVLFLVVIGGIFIGWFTPNEGAAIGCLLSLVYMIIQKKFSWHSFLFCVEETAKTVGMTFLIVIGATLFGNFLAVTKLPQTLAAWCIGLNASRYVVLLMILVIYAILGCFMDAMAMLLLTVPIFVPVIQSLGFDTVWFGVVMVLVMELGLVTPPVGLNCYVMAGIAKEVPLQKIFSGSLPFAIAIAAAVILVIVFPQLATWLPGLLF